jgi:hypothetical protein
VQTPGLWVVAAGNFGCVVAFQMVCNLRFFIKAFVAAARPKFLQPWAWRLHIVGNSYFIFSNDR